MSSRDPNNPPRRHAPSAGAPRRAATGEGSPADTGAMTGNGSTRGQPEANARVRPAAPPPARSRAAGDPFLDDDTDFGGSSGDAFAVSNQRSRSQTAAPRSGADDPNDPAAWGDMMDGWTDTAEPWDAVSPSPAPTRRPAPQLRRRREPVRAPEPDDVIADPPEAPIAAPRRRSLPTPRGPRPNIALPSGALSALAVGGALVRDQVSGILLLANVLSLVAMIIRIATLVGRLPDTIVIQLDAAGIASQWASPEVLWRLPLIAGMVLLMNLVVAWFVSPIDRFAARFVIGAALGIQLLIWIAVLDFV